MRLSWSGSSGSMRATHIKTPHFGQLGRSYFIRSTVTPKDVCIARTPQMLFGNSLATTLILKCVRVPLSATEQTWDMSADKIA